MLNTGVFTRFKLESQITPRSPAGDPGCLPGSLSTVDLRPPFSSATEGIFPLSAKGFDSYRGFGKVNAKTEVHEV